MKAIDRITASYMDKKKENNISGIQVVACEKINNNGVTLLVSSALPVTKSAVIAFVHDATNYGLSPFHNSYTEYNKNDGNFYASIIAYRLPFKMKIEEIGMAKIGASSYLDSAVDEVWEKTEMEGKSVFYRKNDTPIESVMDTLMTASVNPDKLSVPKVSVKKNAVVEAFYLSAKGEPGTIMGTITNIVDDKVILSANDKQYTVNASAIYKDVIVGATASEAMEYLKKAYSNGNSVEYEELIEKMFNGVE